MEARSVTSHPPCLLNSDCHWKGNDASCVHPFSIDNVTRLIRIGHNQGPPILFVGSINELYQTSEKQKFFYLHLDIKTDSIFIIIKSLEVHDHLIKIN